MNKKSGIREILLILLSYNAKTKSLSLYTINPILRKCVFIDNPRATII